MFPPTTKNLRLMQMADAQRGKLARVGKDLEGCLIFKTTSRQALYIPVGCIHAVFTIHGGFLLSIEFSTPESVRVLAALLNSNFDRFKDQYAQCELPGQFIESINLALQQNRPLVGLKAWIDIEDRIRRWASKCEDGNQATKNKHWIKRRDAWKKKVSTTWDRFFSSVHSKTVICPCGTMEMGISLKDHFRAKHMFTVSDASRNGKQKESRKFGSEADQGKCKRT